MDESMYALRYEGNVCISGLTASGKTTHSHLLAGEFGLTYVSGSQIQLNFMGVSPIQKKDFWITPAAKVFWNEQQFDRIDSELLRIESISDGCIFDTNTMPWRHKRPALCIWLESTLESRVLKSIISHRGRSQYPDDEYPERIADKDASTITLYRNLYGIEVGSDLSCFDLVIDISSLITGASLDVSLNSIASAHSIIRPAAAFYLTKQPSFRLALEAAADRFRHLITKNALLD